MKYTNLSSIFVFLAALTIGNFANAQGAATGTAGGIVVSFTYSTASQFPPTKPAYLQLASFTATKVSLSWKASMPTKTPRTIDHYDVLRNGIKIAQTQGTTFDANYTPSGSTLEFFTVRAVDSKGVLSAESGEVLAPNYANSTLGVDIQVKTVRVLRNKVGFLGFQGGSKVYQKYTSSEASAQRSTDSYFWKWEITNRETLDVSSGSWSYSVSGTLTSAGVDGWPASGTFAISPSDPTLIEIVGGDGTRTGWGRFRSARNPEGLINLRIDDASSNTDYFYDDTVTEDNYVRYSFHVETEYTDGQLDDLISSGYAQGQTLLPSLDWDTGVTVAQGELEVGLPEFANSPAYRFTEESDDYTFTEISGGQYRLKVTSVGNQTIRWAEVTVPDDEGANTVTHIFEETVNVTTGDGAFTAVHTIAPPSVPGTTFIRILSSQLAVRTSSTAAVAHSQGRLFETGAVFKGGVAEVSVTTPDIGSSTTLFSSAIITYSATDGIVKLVAIDPAVEDEQGVEVAIDEGYEIPSGTDLLADPNYPGFPSWGGWKLVAIGLKTGSASIQVALSNTIDSAPTTQSVVVGVYPQFEVAVDANRDSQIRFASEDASDQASADMPYRFWLNDDVDRLGLTAGEEKVQDDDNPNNPDPDDVVPAFRGKLDYQLDKIPCERDLEDFSRLWINLSDLQSLVATTNSSISIGLKWQNTNGTTPAIKLYSAAEADGGTKYLTDLSTATQQIGMSVVKDASQPVAQVNPVIKPTANSYDFVLPDSLVQNLTAAQSTLHLLFEGCQRGTGQLTLVILQKDASGNLTKIGDGPGIYFDLKNIKEMYERWTVGDGPAVPFLSPTGSGGGGPPRATAKISQDRLPADAIAGQYTAQSTEQNKYILYVHGWNMHPWEKDAFAETAFKRLYWQGYKGGFGAFQWPTTYHKLAPAGLFDYDTGEYSSWLSATPLKNLLSSLSTAYSGKVYVLAHSMGNVVTGEALRLAAQDGHQVVAAYVATQAAVPVHCYDPAQPTPPDFFSTWRSPPGSSLQIFVGAATTPKIYPNWLATNSTASGGRGNFYNPNDFALSRGAWETDQALKPNSIVGPRAPYGFSGNVDATPVEDGFYYQTIVTSGGPHPITSTKKNPLHLGDGTNIMDRYEIMAFAAQPRSRALGTTAPASGTEWSGQDLRALPGGVGVWPADTLPNSSGDYSEHPWHSAQFRFTNMEQKEYWRVLLGQNGFSLR